MLPISTKQLHRFTPPDALFRPDPPVYLLATPTVWARAELQQRLAAAGAINPSDDELRAAFLAGARAALPPAEAEELKALLDAAGHEAFDDDKQALIDAAERAVRAAHRPYQAMLGERTRYFELRPLIACKLLLRGVENVDAEFTTRFGEADDDTLARLDHSHLVQAGLHAVGLMYLPRGLEKNSEPPPQSPPAPKTSAAEDSPPTRPSSGTSSGKSTKKTRAS